MYLSKVTIENFRCFGSGDDRFEMQLRPGLTALVGENDCGKSAVIDALRLVLGTTDQEWYPRLEATDFHGEDSTLQVKITCRFEGLEPQDRRAFLEYLTYGDEGNYEPLLYVNWTAQDNGERRNGQPYRRVEVCSGKSGDGPAIDIAARHLLRTVYLRPLRDAEQALTAGRSSRLARILEHCDGVNEGQVEYDPAAMLDGQDLSVQAIGKLLNSLLEQQAGIRNTQGRIDSNLSQLSLQQDPLRSNIKVSGGRVSDDTLLRELLQKLDLRLVGDGRLGLGSDNLLFIACELLLLAQEREGTRLLLIEEPEAHLHAQRQLRVMQFLEEEAKKNGIQVIVTTHSPNLASTIRLDNLIVIHKRHAFSLAYGQTRLRPSDYRFLERFLDVTKANLFFAHGVMIVEGDAENILLPTLARLIGRDFTKHGVSIVNVGGVGLRRYARIFQRELMDLDAEKQMHVPVACLTDMDVMPDCAPELVGKAKERDEWPAGRKWKVKKDIADLGEYRKGREVRASGQCVQTFVSDEWTFEYDMALGPSNHAGDFGEGASLEVYTAACLAEEDDAISSGSTSVSRIVRRAKKEFAELKMSVEPSDGCTLQEVLACHVYAKFARDGVSKPVAAQYLAEILRHRTGWGKFAPATVREYLPKYIVAAIDYVTEYTEAVEEAVDLDADANERTEHIQDA